MVATPYSLEQASADIAALRGQVDRLTEVVTFNDSVSPGPNNPAAGAILYSLGGGVKYASPDANDYNVGRLTLGAGALTLTGSLTTIPGLTAPLAIGTYHFCGQILINPTASGGALSYQLASSGGLAASGMRTAFNETTAGNAAVVSDYVANFAAFTGGTIGAGLAHRICVYDGWIVVSTPGTLNMQMSVSAGGAGVLQFGSYLEIFPVT